ncbi:MAG: SemiSWEET family transporter [Pseudomonadota bacterium]
MDSVDLIGWAASAVLIATLARQVYSQWRSRSVEGVSHWLFIGQLCASIGFTVYSWLLGNGVFVFTNSVLLLTAVIGQLIYRRNRRLAERGNAA